MRIDILKDGKETYTGWSAEKPIEPGDHGDFEVFFYPNISGNYTARIFFYDCNTMQELKSASFSAYVPWNQASETANASNASAPAKVTPIPPAPFEVKTTNTNGSVQFTIKSKTALNDLVIVPVKYPLGWIAESASVGEIKAGEERTIVVTYVPSVWKPVDIAYEITTLDGSYHQAVTVTLSEEKKGYSMEQLSIGLLMIAVLFLATLLIREKRKGK